MGELSLNEHHRAAITERIASSTVGIAWWITRVGQPSIAVLFADVREEHIERTSYGILHGRIELRLESAL
jgi:hypothetical protein